MKISKRQRTASVLKAEAALAVHKALDGLTDVEALQVLTDVQQTMLKYMLRIERHGDPDKPAGLE